MLSFSACQPATEENERRTVTSAPGAAAGTDEEGDASEADANPQTPANPEDEDNGNYTMTGERPAEVCGKAGFTYLSRGYLFKECGTCHFNDNQFGVCLLYTSPSPRDRQKSRMPSSA